MFKPARGTEVEVTVEWKDEKGKEQRVDARQWLRAITAFQKLPEMQKAVRELERRVHSMEGAPEKKS